MTFNFSSQLRDEIRFELFNSANESIVYFDEVNNEDINYIRTICVSSTDCYRLESNSFSKSAESEVTSDVIFNDDIIINNLPATSEALFGYAAANKAIRQNTCNNFQICSMDLVDGSLKRKALNIITKFADINHFDDHLSPQYQALCWLLNDADDVIESSIVQRYILAVFFYSTNGEEWGKNEHWLTKTEQCKWYGVSCHNFDGVVSKLNLSSNNLYGSLPTEIGELKGLEYIELSYNELNGIFPLEIVKLQNLRAINLSNNIFQGTIPPRIKHIKLLNEFMLSSNQFTGTLPSEIGKLTEIEILELSNNSFTGAIVDAIHDLTKLKNLNVSSNLFRGEVMKLKNIVTLGK